jgi:peptide/nickel transport system substrate-binding protein
MVPSSSIRDARSEYDIPVNVRSSGWCSDWPTGSSWFPAQWDGDLVGQKGMPNLANFDEPDADALQDEFQDDPRRDMAGAWGEFDKIMQETYYPAVNLGYAGAAYIRGSDVGGMFIDNVRGMPTFQTMYVKKR